MINMNDIEGKVKELEKKFNDLTITVNILTVAAFISAGISLALALTR
jgi:hypothetical protein